MGDDQRRRAAAALPDPAEDQPHHGVAGEAAEPLIEVVRTPQHRARDQRLVVRPAEPTQPVQQVRRDQHLFQQRVLPGGQDQHRDPPPNVGQVLRHHRQVGAEPPGGEIEPQSGAADDRRQRQTRQHLPTVTAQADRRQRLATATQEVRDEPDRNQPGDDAEQLVREVQPGSARCLGAVERRDLGAESGARRSGRRSAVRTRKHPRRQGKARRPARSPRPAASGAGPDATVVGRRWSARRWLARRSGTARIMASPTSSARRYAAQRLADLAERDGQRLPPVTQRRQAGRLPRARRQHGVRRPWRGSDEFGAGRRLHPLGVGAEFLEDRARQPVPRRLAAAGQVVDARWRRVLAARSTRPRARSADQVGQPRWSSTTVSVSRSPSSRAMVLTKLPPAAP